MPSLKLLTLGFAAGFIATLIFHQGLWYIFNQVGVIPLDRPAWAMDSTSPFEIPAVLSKAFWGGLWGLVLTSILMHLDGMSYWAAWIVLGAVALTAVAFFVVPPLKFAESMEVFRSWYSRGHGQDLESWDLARELLTV